jgi:hypothetical protein
VRLTVVDLSRVGGIIGQPSFYYQITLILPEIFSPFIDFKYSLSTFYEFFLIHYRRFFIYHSEAFRSLRPFATVNDYCRRFSTRFPQSLPGRLKKFYGHAPRGFLGPGQRCDHRPKPGPKRTTSIIRLPPGRRHLFNRSIKMSKNATDRWQSLPARDHRLMSIIAPSRS